MRVLSLPITLLRIVVHLFRGLRLAYGPLRHASEAQRAEIVTLWSHQLLALLGIELQIKGQAQQQGGILWVANHLSWLDVTVLHASVFCRFIAKHEIESWPVIGQLARATGTIFIQRGKKGSAYDKIAQTAVLLSQGERIAVFPEGATTDGLGELRFHSNFFQAAIDGQVPVQAIAISYIDKATGQRSAAANYVGDMFLLTSVWRTVSAPPLIAIVEFAPPIATSEQLRRNLAQQAQNQVSQMRKP